MDRNEVIRADELVELDVVHVAGLAQVRRVEDHKDVVAINVNLGHVIAFDAVLDCQRMEAEEIGQHLSGPNVAYRDVDPGDRVFTIEEFLELVDRTLFNSALRKQVDIHPARHLLQPNDHAA